MYECLETLWPYCQIEFSVSTPWIEYVRPQKTNDFSTDLCKSAGINFLWLATHITLSEVPDFIEELSLVDISPSRSAVLPLCMVLYQRHRQRETARLGKPALKEVSGFS